MYNLLVILGPTATGKTHFAALMADRLGGEVISADSRQVYRGMDIGTGKDYNEYIIRGMQIPVHLIDIADPEEEYNVFRFQKDFFRVFNEIQERGKLPVLCGGSGLYVESVLKSYRLTGVPVNEDLRKSLETLDDKILIERLKRYRTVHNTTDILIRKRLIRAIEIEEYLLIHPDLRTDYPGLKPLIIGLDINRDLRREKITRRLEQRLSSGMVEETKKLLESGITPEKLEFFGLEYKYLNRFVLGKMSYNEMFQSLNTAIHQFAKRQMTWFRKMEKEGFFIHWIPAEMDDEEKVGKVLELFSEGGNPPAKRL